MHLRIRLSTRFSSTNIHIILKKLLPLVISILKGNIIRISSSLVAGNTATTNDLKYIHIIWTSFWFSAIYIQL